jgi:DNA-binding MarR family transcriptional regulator
MTNSAERFDDLFRQVYLTFHRRDEKRSQLSGASAAVLTHLSMSGPLTIGELAAHLDRAQSVASDIVSGLERKGLVERRDDRTDRRRTLVWLTEHGEDALRAYDSVLGHDRLQYALARLTTAETDGLFTALRRLVDSAPPRDGR